MELAFYFSSLVAVLATFRVIIHTQPVHALLYLMISLLSIACVFFSLGAQFAGALEIIVYAGAIMVLFVFVIMMLNISIGHNKHKHAWLPLRSWIWPLLVSLTLLMVLVRALVDVGDHSIKGDLITAKTVAIVLFGPYVLAVELSSILLLVGLIIAFHLCRNEQNNIDAPHYGSKIIHNTKIREEE